jgi:7-cyano-7-deazaguanine synthase
MPNHAVILLSGGIDSAVCLALARVRHDTLTAVSVDYGQRNRSELEAARLLAGWAQAHHLVIPLDFGAWNGQAGTKGGPYVPGRNLVFLSLCVSVAEAADAGAIYLGATASDKHFPDAGPEFLAAFRTVARIATKAGVEGASIDIKAPLLPLSKEQVIAAGLRLGVPLELTRSCYETEIPCGVCGACRTRAEGFARVRLTDPLLETS